MNPISLIKRALHSHHLHSVGTIVTPVYDRYPCGDPNRGPYESNYLHVEWCCVCGGLSYFRHHVLGPMETVMPDDWRDTVLPRVRQNALNKDRSRD